MPPRLRKLMLTVHVTLSTSWVGAVAAYLVLDVASATSDDAVILRAAYVGMWLIAGWVILPLAIATLVTGIIMGLGTRWGLFRHYWVLISLLATAAATAVLLAETQTIRQLAVTAADPAASAEELRSLGTTLAHSAGGLLVLLGVLVLNMYKPRGLTRYGWRKEDRRPPSEVI